VLFESIDKLLLFLSRPVVQTQLITVLIAIGISFFLSKVVAIFLNRTFSIKTEDDTTERNIETGDVFQDMATEKTTQEDDKPKEETTRKDDKPEEEVKPSLVQHAVAMFNWISFPLFGLIIFQALQGQFGLFVGILSKAIFVFSMFLIYRFVVGGIYEIFGKPAGSRYHYRLLGPLFTLFILYHLLTDFVNFPILAQVKLVDLTENPLTLGAFFLTVLGLYFWIDSILGAEHVIGHGVTRFTNVNEGTVDATLSLTRYILVGFGIYIALTNVGLDSTTVAAITGGLSVGLGFGLQDIATNFVSGIIMLFEQKIRVGDVVDFGSGNVVIRNIQVRATTVYSPWGTEIIMPNRNLLASQITTYPEPKWAGVNLIVPKDVSIPAKFFEDIVKKIQEHPAVLSDPAPMITYDGFDCSQITYWLWFTTDKPIAEWFTKVAVKELMFEVIKEYDIPVYTDSVDTELRLEHKDLLTKFAR
jgi:small-conductance mechanosensitive channel